MPTAGGGGKSTSSHKLSVRSTRLQRSGLVSIDPAAAVTRIFLRWALGLETVKQGLWVDLLRQVCGV